MSFVYITEDGVKLSKRGGTISISRDQESVVDIPIETIENLILIDEIQVSSQVIVNLLMRKIPMTWISSSGTFCGCLDMADYMQPLKAQKQLLIQNTEFSFVLAKKIADSALKNKITLLRQYERCITNEKINEQIKKLKDLRKSIGKIRTEKDLENIQIEENKLYTCAMNLHIQDLTSRQNQKEYQCLFDLLTKIGKGLIRSETYNAVMRCGLNPYFGFITTNLTTYPALSISISSEWKELVVDVIVVELIRKHSIAACHLEYRRQRNLSITTEGERIFFKAYEKKMRSNRKYLADRVSFRYIIQRQSQQYEEAVMKEDATLYEPFTF